MTYRKCTLQVTTVGSGDSSLRHSFVDAGGDIGRVAPCVWVLPGKRVSRTHASILYEAGEFYVVDRSQNGTYLNGERLRQGERQRLCDGFQLTIADYAISVQLSEPASQSSGSENNQPHLEGLLLLKKRIDGGENRQVATHLGSPSLLLKAFAEGAGVPLSVLATDDEQNLARRLGAMFRLAVGGVHKLLNAQEEVKRNFKIPSVEAKSRGNNPFRLQPDDAIEQALGSNDAFLSGERAFENAFGIMNAHELATVAGMEAMIDAIVEYFDPELLEARFAERSSGSFLPSDHWRSYRQEYSELADLLDEKELIRKFGGSFEKAYMETVKRLTRDFDEDTL